MINLSSLVESEFPEYYKEDGANFIAFLKAYYEWVEQSNQVRPDQLLGLRDIDTTVDEFIRHFRSAYIANIPDIIPGNPRTLIKNIGTLYDTKGTPQAIKLLLRILFDVETEIYYPGDDVFMASAGSWIVPTYLEVTISDRTKQFVGRSIRGVSSGAGAIVEAVVRRQTNGRYFDVVYLSSLEGSFKAGELITDQGGDLADSPQIIGSLNHIIILDGGSNNSIGDIFAITSLSGKQGIARVVEIVNATGRVSFNLEDGGTGYTANASTIVSDKIINYSGNATNSNSSITNFQNFEVIEQPLFNLNFLAANNNFANGDVIKVYTSGTFIEQANCLAISSTQTGANGSLTLYVLAGDVRFGDVIRKQGNTIGANIANTANVTATGVVVGESSSAVGVYNITNTFKAFNGFTRVRGRTSNTFANVLSFGQGSGATFSVGSLSGVETVYVYRDRLNDRNTSNVAFMDIRLDGYGSGLGLVNSVSVSAGGASYTNGDLLIFFGGGQSIASVTINAGGTLYKNGEHIVAATGRDAALEVTTNSSGGITSVSVIDGGTNHLIPPVLTVNTSAGSGATLTAVLVNANAVANASVTTNSTGGIASITVANTGGGYFSNPIITVSSSGTGANLVPVMKFGYGFPKSPGSGYNDTLISALRSQSVNVGTIASLGGVSPGADYNHSPFVSVFEPLTVGLNRRDVILQLSNIVGAFAPGETITQLLTSNLVTLTYSGITGNSAFDINEIVTQNSGAATGTVIDKDATTLKLHDATGTFVNTSNTATKITGLNSLAVANVANVSLSTPTSVAKGVVKFANTTAIIVRRENINLNFDLSRAISGTLSQASANLVTYDYDFSSPPMGNNAVVSANVQTANGVASELEVVSSGFGFSNGQMLSIVNPLNNTVISGLALLQKEGTGEGIFSSTQGFTSEDKFLYDGEYYQKYSYETRTSLSLDKYSDILKSILHVAGTKLFGSVLHTGDLLAVTDIITDFIQESQAVNILAGNTEGLVITGRLANTFSGVGILSGLGSLSLTGLAPTWSSSVSTSFTFSPGGVSNIILQGFAPTYTLGAGSSPGFSTLALTGFSQSSQADSRLTTDVQTLAITNLAATATSSANSGLAVSNIIITGQIQTLSSDVNPTTDIGSLTISGQIPIVQNSMGRTLGFTTLVFTGFAATVASSVNPLPGVSALVINGFAVSTSAPGTDSLDFSIPNDSEYLPPIM